MNLQWDEQCKLYPPEKELTKAKQPSLNLEGGAKVNLTTSKDS